MYKIRDDVDLKEDAKVCYYRLTPLIKKPTSIFVKIFKDRTIDFQLPLGCTIKKQEIRIEEYIQDLIKANLVVKE